jgi:hypothetical protein
MALKNSKWYQGEIARNGGIMAVDQVQIVTRAAVPTDADLANGRIVYVTGTGLRAYIGGAWVTLGAGAGGVSTWDSMYDADKSLAVDDGTMTFAGATALGAGDVITITAAAAVTGDCLQFTNSGSGSDIKGTSNTWSVSKAGAAVFTSMQATAITSATNVAIDATGAGTIVLGATSTGGITLTRATTCGATLTVTGGADADAFIITAGDVLISDGHISMVQPDNESSIEITAAGTTTASALLITVDAITEGNALDIDAGGATMSTGFYINCNDDNVAVFTVGADGATTIASAVNSTVALAVTGIQTNEDMVKFSSNGVTATGQSTLLVTAAGATAAGSAVLLVNATGEPAASTSYLAVFDYETATEATNDPITVEIRGGTSVGACLNIISKATTITGGVLNFTCAELTTGIGINMQGLVALTTGNAIRIAHTTEPIVEGGCLVRIASSGVNTGDTIATMLNIAGSGQLAGTQVKITSIQTTGTVMNITSSGVMTTTGNLLTLTGNSATTAAGLLRVNANALTSGIGVIIASSSTALTTGYLFNVSHSGNATAGNPSVLSCFSSAAAEDTTIVQVIASDVLAGGVALDISLAAMTTGKGIDLSNLDAITTGKALHIDATGVTQTSGILVHIDSASTALTGAGRLLLVDHTGNAGNASGIVAEIKSAAADETIVFQVLDAAALALGMLVNLSGVAVTTGTVLNFASMDALTTGIGLSIASGSAALTGAGRLVYVNHTGAATAATTAKIVEFASNATEDTEIFKVTASAALAAGMAVNISCAAMTTGTALNFVSADALTTGVIINAHSNSADVTARSLFHIHNDNAAAVGATPIEIINDAVQGTGSKWAIGIKIGLNTIWMSDGTTSPNANLTGTTGDIALNCDSNKPYSCTNGAGKLWTALV